MTCHPINTVDGEGSSRLWASPPDHVKKNQCTRISFQSLNTQHCLAASNSVRRDLVGLKHYFLLLQEPYCTGGRVQGFRDAGNIFSSGIRPHTAIINSRMQNVWHCPKFSEEDVCTTLWITGSYRYPKIYVVSMYLDITADILDIFPVSWKKLVAHCSVNNIPLIAGIDANAHSTRWGEETNRRGEVIEEFSLAGGLTLHKVGRPPTFVARGTSICINITLTMNGASDLIQSQAASNRVPLSDHRMITFQILPFNAWPF